MDDFDTVDQQSSSSKGFNSFVYWREEIAEPSALPSLSDEEDSEQEEAEPRVVAEKPEKQEEKSELRDEKETEELASEFNSFVFWKQDFVDLDDLASLSGSEEELNTEDLKEAHVKLRVEHEELEREHEKLKRHKRDRSLIYQAEIQKLQEAVVDTEVEKDKALEEERLAEEAAKNNNGDQPPEQRDRKHNRQRSVYYQEQLQKLQENLREAEKEKDEALARAKLIASDPSVPPELQKSGYMEDGYLDPKSNKYSFAELSKGKVSGINKRKKELYLTDEEFSIVFEKPRDEFNNLKEWQKQKIKRDVGLF